MQMKMKTLTQDNALLAHLVRNVSEVYFDDEPVDTKICDLMASSHKS
jgi:hypothetical protein